MPYYVINDVLFPPEVINVEDVLLKVRIQPAEAWNIAEPYMDENKPRLEPNFSFDLCRLGCSIFDYLIEDLKEVDDLDDAPIIKIISDWCKDDKGRNIMYKVNGQERYPEFKLYKMIARTVHNHTPDKVLENVFFHRYLTGKIKKKERCMNIDKIPEYHSK